MLLFSLEISLAGEGSDVVWSIRSFVQNLVQCIKMFVFFFLESKLSKFLIE